jgi:ABC-type nickel/cobalt efflux system permease component RcnA
MTSVVGMNRTLAIGYLLAIVPLVAMVLVARGTLPNLDGFASFFASNCLGLILLPAAYFLFRGARTSHSRLRKALGYGASALSFFVGVGSVVAVVLVMAGSAKPI